MFIYNVLLHVAEYFHYFDGRVMAYMLNGKHSLEKLKWLVRFKCFKNIAYALKL